MNAPNRFELFVLSEGEKGLEIQEDTKIPNAATIKFIKQDHTLANMIRGQLLANPAVLFAGYKVPHPLEPHFFIKVQTDGSITPVNVMLEACNHLLKSLNNLEKKFTEEFRTKEVDQQIGEDVYGGQFGGTSGATTSRDAWGEWGGRRKATEDYLDF